MAKKMKLNSLLAANRNKGIEKMSDYSNREKEKEQKKIPTETKTPTELKKNAATHLTPAKTVKKNERTAAMQQAKETNALNLAREQAHEEATRMKDIASEHETKSEPRQKTHRRGRRRQYKDPRLKALEMQKISARTKIRLQNLIDFKFDNKTIDSMIDFLYTSYFERELSMDDRNFLTQLEESSMADYLEDPKYKKLFEQIRREQSGKD